jgi:hypothetical protein
MTVYIVTDGTYSSYRIERVFSNPDAAEEYRKWHNIDNEIEEYEIYDTAFTKEDGKKVMFIKVYGTVYPEAVVNIRYEIRPDMINEDRRNISGAGLLDYRKSGVFTIYNYHYIPAEKWNEAKYKDKFTKSLYDLAGMAKAMFADGACASMIDDVLRDKAIEYNN